MAKTNGIAVFKWVGAVITFGTFSVMVFTIIWNASTINSTLAANCKEDGVVHAIVYKDHDTIIEHEKDIQMLQRNMVEQQRQIMEGQKEILRALAR